MRLSWASRCGLRRWRAGRQRRWGWTVTDQLLQIIRSLQRRWRWGDVVDYYDRGGSANPGLDLILHPLGLSVEDKCALIVFLRTLSGRIHEGR